MNAIAEDPHRLDSTLQAGQLLEGKYRVDYLVGQGGMAAVWAGTNERTGKRVALKVLLPSLAAIPGVDALFHREGLASSRVNHPNVVSVFDVIEHDKTACIVMELLDGEPLGNYLVRSGPLPVGEACSLLLPAMRGVASAHAQGVIHRDVKPQNIFICMDPDGRAVTTKVLDFGISMIVERARDPVVGPVPNMPMGTPAYMAPEHFSGAAPVDTGADVYGFGVIFYEALTGQVPFAGEPGPELYQRILCDPVPPLAQLRPDVPSGLVRVIETALAKDPAQRHHCVHRMIDAIEAELPFALLSDGGAEARAAGRVEALVAKEKTEEHQVTRFMAGFSLARETRPRELALDGRGQPASAARLPDGTTPVFVPPFRSLRSLQSRASGLLRTRRGWLATAVGCAILLAATGVVWRAVARSADQQRRADAARLVGPAPRAAVVVPLPQSHVEAGPSKPAAGQGAPTQEEVVTSPGSPSLARLDPPNPSEPEIGRASGVPGSDSQAARKSSGKRKKVAAPRAGSLSVEDF